LVRPKAIWLWRFPYNVAGLDRDGSVRRCVRHKHHIVARLDAFNMRRVPHCYVFSRGLRKDGGRLPVALG
jgi:hypothetical protein